MSQAYQRHSTVALEDVLPYISPHDKKMKNRINGVSVKITGLRLRNFARSTRCSCCGLEASFFAIETNNGDPKSMHLNLYGIRDDQEVLFTHDHTISRGNGGADSFENTTTMCIDCNRTKAVLEYIPNPKRNEIKHA